MSFYPGFNTNVRFRGIQYHVQTEVISSEETKKISTHLYCDGKICYSETSLGDENMFFERETLLLLVESQHKNVIKKLLTGVIEIKNEEDESINFIALYSSDKVVSKSSKELKFAEVVRGLILSRNAVISP